ncbi:hypothetical protein ElyMa_000439300 [Elysia marginata]|uniref:DUF7869 domain-containing protein n=1 Tax=Elysia marginata TaxID=1093978 RepID=A0AAV4FMW0_9GAST|nr:hypothetical protein ElyMa_000439300 [Elysia marginata]
MARLIESKVNTIARLLNLNATDTGTYQEAFDAYFGKRDESELSSGAEESNEDDSDSDSEPACCRGNENDLSERIVPRQRVAAQLPPENVLNQSDQLEPSTPKQSSALNKSDQLGPSTPKQSSNGFPCDCKAKPCYLNFGADDIKEIRYQYTSLTDKELDIAILSKIACGIHLDPTTRKSRKPVQTERKASRTDYLLHGHRICRPFFLFIHSIGFGKLTTLIKHYKENGVEERIHKGTKRLPHYTLKYDDKRRVVDYILNYAEANAIELPGRTPRHWITNAKLLPTNCTKAKVYDMYKAATEKLGNFCVHVSTFRKLWRQLVPYVRTMPPATDLCWTCQKGMQKIQLSANNDEEKRRRIAELNTHQEIVQNERSFYQHCCEAAKKQLPPDRRLGPHPHCSFEGVNHVSFDFAQQTHFPSDPLQAGPIYFKTPRKCGIFWINNEAFGRQINILFNESHNTGKGANTVVSYLHFYLDNYSLGETELQLHADNCAGQNKNSVMVWYLLWRCMTGRNRSVKLSFLIAGHTKFSPHSGFRLIKRKLKPTRVDCLADIAQVVNDSSTMNEAVLVGAENGPLQISTYNWATYLSSFFVKVKGIKSLQHFKIDNTGSVAVMQHSNAPETTQDLRKGPVPAPETLPPVIPSPGLNNKRQQYLFKEIWEFVSPNCQDIVAPEPAAADDTEADSDSHDPVDEPVKPAKKARPTAGRGKARRGRGCQD